jgi:hypothetical protein
LSQLEDSPQDGNICGFFFGAFFPPPTKLSRIGWSSTMHLYMYVCLQAFVAPPLTSHIFKAFWQTIKLIYLSWTRKLEIDKLRL